MDAEDQIFWTFFITTMCGFIITMSRQMYKSKCSEVSFCGVKIKRDTESETQFDENQLSRMPQQQVQSFQDLESLKIDIPIDIQKQSPK